MQNLYALHYQLDQIGPNLETVLEFLNKKIDSTNPGSLLLIREEARLLLNVASKCHFSADYYYRKLGKRVGEEYALLSSLREYTEMVKKDCDTLLYSLSNSINYYKNER
jgi:hypothetical protein